MGFRRLEEVEKLRNFKIVFGVEEIFRMESFVEETEMIIVKLKVIEVIRRF